MEKTEATEENKETQTAGTPAEESAAGEAAGKTAGKTAEADGAAKEPAEGEETPAAAEPAAPDWKDMYARTMADFENYRKRVARDREDLARFAKGDVLKDMLPTVDNLARALDCAKDPEDPFVKGVRQVYDALLKTLAAHGATPLDSVGEPLDTDFHEAIAAMPSPDVPEGSVMTEVERGWLLDGKTLRVAKVVVSTGKGE